MFPAAARQLRAILTQTAFQTVLNVGSSTRLFYMEQQPYIWEHVLEPLLARGNAVLNVDQKAADGVHLVRAADALGLVDFADVVLCCNLLEHVVDPGAVLASLTRALKPGGRLILDGPVQYPYHPDPIDNGLRPQTLEAWDALVGPAYVRRGHWLITETRGTSMITDYQKR